MEDQQRIQESKKPLRVISMAWGKKFVDEFLDLCLPALLSPGNLPLLTEHFSTELVFVTESTLFDYVHKNCAYLNATKVCSVRLIALDDLVATKDSYGMSITYALYRGFEDLGQEMVDCYLLFLNSDFILADNSYKGLLPHLLRGERLVLAPSYCADSEKVIPEILSYKDHNRSTMAINPRCLADIILRHRHLTIRTKTINQKIYSSNYIDQFYLAVNENTLIGHQLPISVVAMKPEKQPAEIDSYWDYELIERFCPTLQHYVISDSDEFLMLELREQNRAINDVSLGWPTPNQIASKLRHVVTNYSATVGRSQLTLHSGDIPEEIQHLRDELRQFFFSVLDELTPIPRYKIHPQWESHFPGFTQVRNAYIENSSQFDSAKFDSQAGEFADGCHTDKNGSSVRTNNIACCDVSQPDHLCTLLQSIEYLQDIQREFVELYQKLSQCLNHENARANIEFSSLAGGSHAQVDYDSLNEIALRVERSFLQLQQQADIVGVILNGGMKNEVENCLCSVYELSRSMSKNLPTSISQLPHTDSQPHTDPQSHIIVYPSSPSSPGIAKRLWYFLFGAAPNYRRWHWLYSATALTRKIIQTNTIRSQTILHVAGSHAIHFVKDSTAAITQIPIKMVKQDFHFENFPDFRSQKFDSCVIEASFSEFCEYLTLHNALKPIIKPGGVIIVFFLNSRGERIPLEPYRFAKDSLPISEPISIHYFGGRMSVAAIKLRMFVESKLNSFRLTPSSLNIALSMFLAAPVALAASFIETHKAVEDVCNPKKNVAAITYIIDIG